MNEAVNIASHLTTMAQRQPGEKAIMFVKGRDAAGKREYGISTFGELEADSNAIAKGLGGIGVKRGMRVALCLRPGVDFFAVTFALFKLGSVPVLIDPGIGRRNFGRCLAESEPEVFIGIQMAHVARCVFGWAKKTARIFISTGWFGGKSLASVRAEGRGAELAETAAGGRDARVTAADDPAAILFTSGSTGAPKGVLYTHGNFDAQVKALKWEYKIEPGEMDLATFPLFGLFGPALGMTTVIPEMDFTRPGSVEPENIIEPILQLGITSLFGSPALIERVGEWGAANGVKLPTLRRVISAGAPVSPRVIGQFAKMLAEGVEVFTPYGATESLPVSSIGSLEILAETGRMAAAGKGTCVGRAVGDMQVRVIRISDGVIEKWSDDLVVPQGEVGEIAVKGRVVTRAYFGRDEATRLAKISDLAGGFWHRMGDVGYVDNEGRIWFCGRKSQRVWTEKGNMYSMPVEGIFNTHPLVKRSALVGVKLGMGICPVVCVELMKGEVPREEALKAELRALAVKFEHTRPITTFLVHPEFPVDIRHNAKIGREKLAIWAKRKLT